MTDIVRAPPAKVATGATTDGLTTCVADGRRFARRRDGSHRSAMKKPHGSRRLHSQTRINDALKAVAKKAAPGR